MVLKTFSDNLKVMGESIKKNFSVLINDYSSLKRNIPDYNSAIYSIQEWKYSWGDLPLEGKRYQSGLLTDFNKFINLIKALIKDLNEDYLRIFDDANAAISSNMKQDSFLYYETKEEIIKATNDEIDKMTQLIDYLDSTENENIYVSDTSALIYNPQIESWIFDDVEKFIIILTPTILSELDKLKINHRNQEVREKAESLIKRIKEFGRRGSLQVGVPIAKDKIYIRCLAVEPNMINSLPWLDEKNNDDRFIASVFEIMRNNIRSSVVLVTKDINMQNKAEFAFIPFCEPPEIEKTLNPGFSPLSEI